MNAVTEPNWMLYASFIISALTLGVLIWYACLTRGIERAANEQSEGLSKPVIVPDVRESGNPDIQIAVLTKFKYGGVGQLAGDYLALKNIGNGPALKLECRITLDSDPKRSDSGELGPYGVPYLEKGGVHRLSPSVDFLLGRTGRIDCTYESVSGKTYSSSAVLQMNGVVPMIDFS